MKESLIEKKLVRAVERAGGLALKFKPDNMAGMPDRLVLLPNGRCVWVELKAPGKKLRALQQKRKRDLESIGQRVYVIDSVVKIEVFIYEVFSA
jgi:hypothetical protein